MITRCPAQSAERSMRSGKENMPVKRDKRERFYTMPDLPREQYEANERMIREKEQRDKEQKEQANGTTH